MTKKNNQENVTARETIPGLHCSLKRSSTTSQKERLSTECQVIKFEAFSELTRIQAIALIIYEFALCSIALNPRQIGDLLPAKFQVSQTAIKKYDLPALVEKEIIEGAITDSGALSRYTAVREMNETNAKDWLADANFKAALNYIRHISTNTNSQADNTYTYFSREDFVMQKYRTKYQPTIDKAIFSIVAVCHIKNFRYPTYEEIAAWINPITFGKSHKEEGSFSFTTIRNHINNSLSGIINLSVIGPRNKITGIYMDMLQTPKYQEYRDLYNQIKKDLAQENLAAFSEYNTTITNTSIVGGNRYNPAVTDFFGKKSSVYEKDIGSESVAEKIDEYDQTTVEEEQAIILLGKMFENKYR